MSQLVETPLYFHEPTCIWAISCRKCTKEGRNLTLKPGQPGLGYELHPPLTNSMLNKESESEVVQSCPTLWDPMDCSPPRSSVHGISQTRILQWDAMPSSRGSSRPRDRTHISYISCIVTKYIPIIIPFSIKQNNDIYRVYFWFKRKHIRDKITISFV